MREEKNVGKEAMEEKKLKLFENHIITMGIK